MDFVADLLEGDFKDLDESILPNIIEGKQNWAWIDGYSPCPSFFQDIFEERALASIYHQHEKIIT